MKFKKSEKSSGNVFADLGFENPEEELMKSDLIAQISRIIKTKGLNQTQVAVTLGVTQPRISALLSGDLDLFSIEKLMNFLKLLGQDIEIVVKPKPKNRKTAHMIVVSSVSRKLRKSSQLNEPNKETIQVFKDTDERKNLNHYKNADDLINEFGLG